MVSQEAQEWAAAQRATSIPKEGQSSDAMKAAAELAVDGPGESGGEESALRRKSTSPKKLRKKSSSPKKDRSARGSTFAVASPLSGGEKSGGETATPKAESAGRKLARGGSKKPVLTAAQKQLETAKTSPAQKMAIAAARISASKQKMGSEAATAAAERSFVTTALMAAQKAQDPKKKEEGRQEKKQAPAPAALPVGSSDGKRRAANFTMSYREQRAQLASVLLVQRIWRGRHQREMFRLLIDYVQLIRQVRQSVEKKHEAEIRKRGGVPKKKKSPKPKSPKDQRAADLRPALGVSTEDLLAPNPAAPAAVSTSVQSSARRGSRESTPGRPSPKKSLLGFGW